MSFLLGQRSHVSLAVGLLAASAVLACARPANAQSNDVGAVVRYADALGTANARLPVTARRELAKRVLLLSSYYELDPCLLGALVTVESSWHARAVSPVGALGYGQLMPETAATLDVDALEPYENLDGTARYLRRLLNHFAGSDSLTRMRLALASYNAGPAAVSRYHGVPPYRETQNYVESVLRTRHTFLLAFESRAARAALALLPAPVPARHTVRRTVRHKQLAAMWHPRHSPYLDALDPNSVPIETPPPVHWETSHSFVARLFGLKHRVAGAPATPAPASLLPASRSAAMTGPTE